MEGKARKGGFWIFSLQACAMSHEALRAQFLSSWYSSYIIAHVAIFPRSLKDISQTKITEKETVNRNKEY
jgi:hypothetical protein